MSSFNLLVRILDTDRLIGINYKDWLRNLRIVLSFEKLTYVLDQDMPVLSAHPSPDQQAEEKIDSSKHVFSKIFTRRL